jgi:NADH-quinone oxidoreductase subunit N
MSESDLLPLIPFLIVAGWACVLLLIDLFIPKDRKDITAILAALGLVAAFILVILDFGENREAFDGMILQDGFSSFLQIIFLAVGMMAIAQAHDYIQRRNIVKGEYYTLLLFATSGMILMAQAGDLIVVFLAIELLSIPLYILSGFARPESGSEEAAMKYFLLGAFASSFVVYGIALVYGATGTTNILGVFSITQTESILQMGLVNTGLLLVGALLILVGLGFKVAAVPFHMWTPDVYHGAPSSVTAFMSVGAKAGGFAALLRVFLVAFPFIAEDWGPIILGVAVVTLAWGNVAAIAQSNIKRMLAYSSIAHAGYILMVLPAATEARLAPDAVSAALFYIFVYAVSNLGAWGVVLALEKAEGKGLSIDDYAGLGAKKPGLALAMALFMLSLTGVPPTAGFVGKFYIFRSVIDAGLIGLALVGVITSLISAYYYLRVVVVMYMRDGEPEVRSDGWLNATLLVTAIGTFILGIMPGPILALVERAGLFGW